MKKVVMFAGPHHEIPPQKGAAIETWIYEVAKRLLTCQIHVISISNRFLPIREFRNGVYFHRIKISKAYRRIFQKILGWDIYSYNDRIFNIIKEIMPDIVHIHNHPDSGKIIPRIRKFNKEIKIILHMHNISGNLDDGFPEIDAFLGCSDFIVNHYKKFIKAKRFETIYNGVDIEKFNKGLIYRNIYKNNLSVRDPKNIFYFGRISPEKGVDKFVKLAALFKQNPRINFYCVGEISRRGGRKKFYEELINLIHKEKIYNITFLDYINPDKIHFAYQMADIVVVPSKFDEPFGMVVIEAMASKIPVIAANKGGMREYLQDNKNCCLIDDYNKFEYIAKEKIINLLNNQEKKRYIIENAFSMVKNQFNWNRISINNENIYTMLTSTD